MLKPLCFVAITLSLLINLPAGASARADVSGSATVSLVPSVQSPQMLGTSVTWTATIQNSKQGHLYDYQFTVTFQNAAQIVRDSSPTSSFTWAPHTVEGNYTVSVKVRDISQLPYVTLPPVAVPFTLLPWVTLPGGSAVNPTSHPLVALFSGPPCAAGHYLQVRFRRIDMQDSMTTNSIPCSQQSANFLIAGMMPLFQYVMHWEEYGPNFQGAIGQDLVFTTGPLPPNYPIPPMQLNVFPTQHDLVYPVVLFGFFPSNNPFYWPTATDLAGNVIWYAPHPMLMTRVEVGGNYLTLADNNNETIFSEYDLAGNQVLSTNVNILNEQLVKMGYPAMTSFNSHEARRLPNGNIMVLGGHDVVSYSAQGGTQDNPVDIIGDMILILDHNMQLVWAWDSFAHEDINRMATLGDICLQHSGGCPAFNPNFKQANDWLHTNAAQLTRDGNIILSQRSQDWVIKVNYANGQGDGSVLWRLGPYGDFTILNPPQKTCGDPNVFPWFTHQHDPGFQFESDSSGAGLKILTVFDDGNLRYKQCNGNQNSRGMVLFMGENDRTIYIETSADLGAYSFAVGSADLLIPGDGNVYASYDNGLIQTQNPTAQSTEVNLAGEIIYQLQAGAWSYRTYRMQNLYTPTLP